VSRYWTVGTHASDDGAARGWAKAGFVEVSRHEADVGHSAPWVLMRFDAPSPL
jgi:hypothetical protein